MSKVPLDWKDFCLFTQQLDGKLFKQNLSSLRPPGQTFSRFLILFFPPLRHFDTENMDVFRIILVYIFQCFKGWDFRKQTNWTASVFEGWFFCCCSALAEVCLCTMFSF